MNRTIKTIFSIGVIFGFLLMAVASIPSDKDYKMTKCDEKTPVSQTGTVNVLVLDRTTDEPIVGAKVDFSWTHYEGRVVEEGGGSIETVCTKKDITNLYPYEEKTTDEAGKANTSVGARTFSNELSGISIFISVEADNYQYNSYNTSRSYYKTGPIDVVIKLLRNESL